MFRAPSHPYTRALLSCLPRPGIAKRRASLQWIGGELPSSRLRVTECIFRSRCPAQTEQCSIAPDWSAVARSTRYAAGMRSSTSRSLRSIARPPLLEPTDEVVLCAEGLKKTFGRHGGAVRAVNDASLRVPRGAIVGLVGESGSGKSTLLRCIAGLEEADQGTTTYLGVEIPANLLARDKSILRTMQMVFQDPESTLNPSLTVGTTLRRHLMSLRPVDAREARRRVENALQQVRLPPRYQHRLPRELSGGEKQRVAIARAFLCAPELVLCDEPLSSLDVSVQSAICQLLLDLQQEGRASYVFVSHDLAIVRYMADRIAVMYLGEVIEEGSAESFDHRPVHPYTEALFSATHQPDPMANSQRVRLVGQISEADKLRPGCIFSPRCHRHKGAECDETRPPWQDVARAPLPLPLESGGARALQGDRVAPLRRRPRGTLNLPASLR